MLRQPVPPHCHQTPQGSEGQGTTNLATEQVWAGGRSRAGPSRPCAEARSHPAPLRSWERWRFLSSKACAWEERE